MLDRLIMSLIALSFSIYVLKTAISLLKHRQRLKGSTPNWLIRYYCICTFKGKPDSEMKVVRAAGEIAVQSLICVVLALAATLINFLDLIKN